MRTLEGNLLIEKKNIENVSQYISPHHPTTEMTVTSASLHANSYSLGRQVNVNEENQLCPEAWGAELLGGGAGAGAGTVDADGVSAGTEQLTEEDRQLAAALVAVQFVQQGRHPMMHDLGHIAKVVSEAGDNTNALLNNPIRLYHHPNEDGQVELRSADLVEVPHYLPPLPPLKRAQDPVWYHNKTYLQYQHTFKTLDQPVTQLQPEECEVDVNTNSLVQNKQQQQHNRKSLPHKKRISRKLKKNVSQPNNHLTNGHQVSDEVQQTVEIIQETVSDDVLDASDHHSMASQQIAEDSAHLKRAMFICQLCGGYFGVDQLQFFHHLKQHYEPTNQTIIMEDSINTIQTSADGLPIDKIAENLVVESNQLPEALVELSLEGTVPDKSSLYATHNKPLNYINADKSLFSTNEKDSLFVTEFKAMYQETYKQPLFPNKVYVCNHCTRSFKRYKQYEMHLREVHSKIDEMSEFSEPEDLMEGINVVEPENDESEYLQDDLSSEHSSNVLIRTSMGSHEQYILPHLTIENGHVHQSHLGNKQWYIKESLDIEHKNDGSMSEIVNTEEVVTGDSMDGMEEATNIDGTCEQQVTCPLCGYQIESRKHFAAHAQQCQMQLKEEVLQNIMNEDVDAEEDVVDEEIINGNDLVVGENQETESKPDKPEEQKTGKKDGKAIHRCAECGREFKHRNSLIYHELSHQGTRPYPCDICKKSFFSASALKVHTRLHSGVKPYKCNECGRTFRQWGDLKYHSISIHSNMKQHQCEYCGKDFARKYSLIVHRRIHTGEKNYKCDFCEKKFRASSYLQNHRRIHTGEKPHTCEICGKAFRMKGDMKRHLNTHAKEKQKSSERERKLSETEEDKETPASAPVKRAKVKTDSSMQLVTPKMEMKIEKQEEVNSDGDRETSNNCDVKESNVSNDEMVSSPSREAVLQDDTRLGTSFPLDGNTQMYPWSVY